MKKHPLYIMVAVDENFGIGKNKTLPWNFKKEMQYFKKASTQTTDPNKKNMVVMGDVTYESLPPAFRPLRDRENVVLTRRDDFHPEGVKLAHSFEEIFTLADDSIEKILILGGESVYRFSIEKDELDGVYLTKIHHSFDCDAFFPQIPARFDKVTKLGEDTENDIRLEFLLYEKS